MSNYDAMHFFSDGLVPDKRTAKSEQHI